MKKKTFLILGMMICFMLPLTSFAKTDYPKPTTRFFVNDFGGVLSTETQQHIYDTSRNYQNAGGQQVVVATVENLQGLSIEDYSINLAREWGIGDKKENNGILILLAVEEREIRVEIGYGLEGVITDSMAGRFIRKATPDLSNNDFDKGIQTIYDLVIQELEHPGSFQEEDENSKDKDSGYSIAFITFIIIYIIISILSGGGRGGRGRRRGRWYGGYRGFGGGYGGFGGGFGGGGFGGGSSGGGFSGGGGSFGGGGSSGKF
ncbi:MAG TPA: TPM domain-containing protein [Candidatus Merdenecus merdavium]|nr:TPM domain-containing protein [Candidatus Merdenecus merdavium]